jgi:plasmid maintenance system antidote protein VapI
MDAAKEGIDRIGQLTWHPGEALPQKFLENLSIPESGVVTWVAVQHEHLQQ